MRKLLLVAAAVALVLTGGAMAVASIPDASGVIHACVQPQNGNITMIIDTDAGQHCAANEQALSWNQTGPQGPQGPAGPAGSSGLASVHVVTADFNGTVGFQTVNCPPGETALSAAVEVVDNNTGQPQPVDPLAGMAPVLTADTPTGYRFDVQSSFGSGHQRFYVTCATTATVTPTTSPPTTTPPTTEPPTTLPPTTIPPTTSPPTTIPPPTTGP